MRKRKTQESFPRGAHGGRGIIGTRKDKRVVYLESGGDKGEREHRRFRQKA